MSQARLGDLCQIRSGGTPSRDVAEFYGGEIPWAKIDDLNAQSGVVIKTVEGITQKGLNAIRGRLFPAGTLLFAMYGSVGKLAWAGCEMSTNQAILGLEILDSNVLDSHYLFRWLQSQRSRFESEASGVTQKNLSAGYVRDQFIPLPPIEEQHRIATILDRADSIRVKRDDTLRMVDEFLYSVFLDMFGDPIQNQKCWTQSTLGEIAPGRGEIVDGPFGSSLKPDQYVDEGIRVIRNFNVRPGYFDPSAYKYVTPEKFAEIRRSEVSEGDLLLSTKGTVGNVCLMPRLEGPSVLSATGTVRIRISSPNVEPVFLMHQMLTSQYQRYIEENQSGAVQQYLNLSGIRDLAIILPPRALQYKFSEIAKRVTLLTKKSKNARHEADKLFASLAHRAFSGQL